MPPSQPPTGGYPPSGDGGYGPPGGQPGSGGPSQSGWSAVPPDPTQQYGQPPYGGQSGGAYQPTEQFPQAQSGYGEPAPPWGQPAGYPGQGGYGGSAGPPTQRSALPWVIGGLVLLLVAGGVGLFFLLKDDTPTPVAGTSSSSTTSAEPTSDEPTTEETTEETTTESSGPSSPTPEEGLPPPAGGPAPVGSGDANVDALSQGCFIGDMEACDNLYTATAGPDLGNPDPTPTLQPFFDYAFTCGDRLTEDEVAERFCVDIWPDA